MVRPNIVGKTTSVGIELYILGIPNVDDEKMELSLDMYFRQVRLFSFSKSVPYKTYKSSTLFLVTSVMHSLMTTIVYFSIGTMTGLNFQHLQLFRINNCQITLTKSSTLI